MQATFHDVHAWAEEHDVLCHGWKVEEINGQRGAVAQQPIHPDDLLVSAPEEMCMRVTTSDFLCPLPEYFIDPEAWVELQNELHVRLALLLIYERRQGEDSDWGTYIASLPRHFTTPIHMSDEELEELQCEDVADSVRASWRERRSASTSADASVIS